MTGTTKVRANKFAADCTDCGTRIAAGAGRLDRAADGWLVRCADTETCATSKQPQADTREAQLAADPGVSGFYTGTEEAALAAAGFDPRIDEVLATAGLRPALAPAKRRTSAHRATTSRRRKCVTGGNCSSTTGINCGGRDCDANAG